MLAIFVGNHKPEGQVYLTEIVSKLAYFKANGIVVHGKRYNFLVSWIIADAPARSFVKKVKGHNYYLVVKNVQLKEYG